MKNSARFTRLALYGLSGFVLVAAIFLWSDRMARAREGDTRREIAAQQQRAQRAVALLYRVFHAENNLTYAARAHTMAAYGDQKIQNVAHIVHAPDHLAVKYLDGHYKGMQLGYSQRWVYRQCQQSKRMKPYAEVDTTPSRISARRFALLLENYRAEWVESAQMQGRRVEVVQLLPAHSIEGARGPARRLWIDTETNLPLRTECFDHQLRPILDTSLSEIDLTPEITPGTFKAPAQILNMSKESPWVTHDMGDNYETVAKMTGLFVPRPQQLPPGFELEYVGAHLLDGLTAKYDGKPRPEAYAALARYTDGLNTLSLFALREQHSQKGAGSETEKADCEFGPGAIAMRAVPDGTLVAVADLPVPLLRRVLASTPEQLLR